MNRTDSGNPCITDMVYACNEARLQDYAAGLECCIVCCGLRHRFDLTVGVCNECRGMESHCRCSGCECGAYDRRIAKYGARPKMKKLTLEYLYGAFEVWGDRIMTPGEFYGEMIWAPYFWHALVYHLSGPTTGREVANGDYLFLAPILDEDRCVFPALAGKGDFACLRKTGDDCTACFIVKEGQFIEL